jgi:hypothetical protein
LAEYGVVGKLKAATWRDYLAAGVSAEEANAIRENTHTGRPLGTPEFLEKIENVTGRQLVPQKGGRPRKPAINPDQGTLLLGPLARDTE